VTDGAPLELSLHIAADPDTVFPYFTDPARYVRWMGTIAVVDPVPGGTYRVRMRDGIEASGRFLDIDPPKRVVFTFGWTHEQAVVTPGSTRVEVTLEPEGGGTRVVLRHHGLPADQTREHRSGWDLYLARLRRAATGDDPGPDPHA
jgi:uncharacterized protein YndB with AHSA1/START domain